MSGRRSHARFVVSEPWPGALTLLRDVVIARTSGDELLAICHTPAVRGEELSLELNSGARTLAVSVEVLESRPVIVDGQVRHRVRLGLVSHPSQQSLPGAVFPQ